MMMLFTCLSGYTCALQKDILYQGRMFVSDHWICFHSKVFGKDTKVPWTGTEFTVLYLRRKMLNVFLYIKLQRRCGKVPKVLRLSHLRLLFPLQRLSVTDCLVFCLSGVIKLKCYHLSVVNTASGLIWWEVIDLKHSPGEASLQHVWQRCCRK